MLLLLVKPLGLYMARVFDGSSAVTRWFGPVERGIYRLCWIDPRASMDWRQYALAMLVFNTLGALLVYALQRLQAYLPLNPQHLSAVSADSAFNTAVSFVTNTNWQGYGGESTMSYLTQMLALAVQNFLSAATGMAVLIALIRGFRIRQAHDLGNFWVDLTRSTLYVLLPLSLVLALVLVGQGVVQSFQPYQTAALVNPITVDEPVTDAAGNPVKDAQGNPQTKPVHIDTQTLPLGPAARQIAIKQLGTNGGGFFNANSAHPFENPTPLSNFLEVSGHPADPGGAVLHLRQHGRRHAPGLGGAGRHAGAVRAAAGAWTAGPRAAPIRPIRADRRPGAPRRCAVRRQHGGQGAALRHRRLGALGRRHHRGLQRLGQFDARLLHAAGRH